MGRDNPNTEGKGDPIKLGQLLTQQKREMATRLPLVKGSPYPHLLEAPMKLELRSQPTGGGEQRSERTNMTEAWADLGTTADKGDREF